MAMAANQALPDHNMMGPGASLILLQQHAHLHLQQQHPQQQHVLVPPNPVLQEEIPRWLDVYSRADPATDHKLKWDMFLVEQLECFEAMLNRLFRDELEELVMR